MSKIKSVKLITYYKEDLYEVEYKSGTLLYYTRIRLPKTVGKFIVNAEHPELRKNPVFNRYEMIYT